ncbi:unnamed protein product, partial [Mesorhabditis spiculigera]
MLMSVVFLATLALVSSTPYCPIVVGPFAVGPSIGGSCAYNPGTYCGYEDYLPVEIGDIPACYAMATCVTLKNPVPARIDYQPVQNGSACPDGQACIQLNGQKNATMW